MTATDRIRCIACGLILGGLLLLGFLASGQAVWPW